MASHDRTRWVPAPTPGLARPRAASRRSDDDSHEVIGPYRLVEEIGEGGMGIVHLAVDPRGRAVAIKVLRAHVAHDEEARRRLAREVDTLSLIRDDRVASVIDADVMGPRPYIVTRYVPGPALDDVVEAEGPLEPDALLRLARGTAEAIRAIHTCGVVHRDIKPGNVLLEDGEPVLIDFGIAHLQDDVRHTIGGLVMGTPGYLSPELVEGAPITDATDWWGWAATITFAASGRPPFGRGRMDAVLTRVRAGEVDLAGVDPRLVPLLRASLSPNPAERPHADDVLVALARFAAGHAATVPTPQGGSWDDQTRVVPPPAASPPAASTQVFQGGGTAVFPKVLSPQWPPPAGPPVRPEASPAPYDMDDEDDEREEPDLLVREGDPRIGLAKRNGTLAALAAALLGALALWPGAAFVSLVAWSVIARAVDRSMTGLVLRRYDYGRRRSDVPWAVVSIPWHAVLGAIATVLSLILPLMVALAGVFTVALMLSGSTGADVAPGSPATLVVGGAIGIAMLWWGPGGASLRRGTRSIVRPMVPAGGASQIVGLALLAAGTALVYLALSRGASISWAPFAGTPFGR